MQEVMPAIEKEFFDRIIIEKLDIADAANYSLLLALKEKYNCLDKGVPAVFIGEKVLVGDDQIKEGIRAAIQGTLEEVRSEKFDKLPGMDIAKHFLSFGWLAVIIAGLIDGINPCAFTVIVFFLSFLAVQGYKKKELIAIGICFILAVFLTYLLIGLGIFRFLYALRNFYFLTKLVYYFIAAFCFILSAFAFYDFWLFKKTGKTEGMALQLPQKIKNIIHFTIGAHYRKRESGQGEGSQPVHKKNFVGLIASALVTGFLISVLEGICTGQLYLPTITLVLKDASLRLRALGYLILYNLMFIAPLLAIMIFTLLGATSANFSKLIKSNISVIKLAMAVLFLGLGFLILLGA
jgi:hypothetical protein